MQNNPLTLFITHAGAKRMQALIAKGKAIALAIAIGDGDPAPNKKIKETTALTNECLRAQACLSNANDNSNSWHINVCFPPGEEEVDIKEIGLFINEGDLLDKANSTLWAMCFNEKPIAKKMPGTDLLMDVVVNVQDFDQKSALNWQNYQPRFTLPPACTQNYGIVKFATKEEVDARVPQLALSTDNLEEIQKAKPQQAKNSQCKLVYSESLTEDIFVPMGLFIAGDTLYGLLMNKVQEEGLAQQFMLVSYDTKCKILSKKVDTARDSDGFNYFACVSGGYKNGSITWFMFKKQPGAVWEVKAAIDNKNTSQWLDISISANRVLLFGSDEEKLAQYEKGSLVFYNQRIGIMGGVSKASDQLLIGEEESTSSPLPFAEKLSLAYARKRPLVHSIQDKIYCLGGGAVGEPLIEIHDIRFEKDKLFHHRFIPENTATLDLSNTEGLTSCLLGARIYIFKPTYYKEEGGDLSFNYYDVFNNSWHKSMLPEGFIQGSGVAPQYGKAISDGQAIYLFFTQAADSKTKLSIFKFIPD